MAFSKPVRYPARDGLTIPAYLTMPRGVEAKKLATVILPHGGPWARDSWGYNPIHQWLANRGYAVLSVNFRGSTGFGKSFLNAGNREWAARMHDDLLDAVDWAVAENIADPERIAIMGGSYGGYATLVGLTFTPETFACGIDIVGPSNIATLLDSIPAYWQPQIELFAKRVGDHRDRAQHVLPGRAGQDADVRTVDVLQRIESGVFGLVEFEDSDDMGVDQSNAELPLAAQDVCALCGVSE